MRCITSVVFAFTLAAPLAIGRAQTLQGAIDMHAHAAPDGTPRKLDVLDLARVAKAAGMRAIVIKNHYEPTASLAYVVRKAVPGIEVFGGISLDLTVGGVNPAAVEWMTKVEGGYGKVVWLPTFDSESQVRLTGAQRPFAPVTRDGKILPEVLAVIALAAKHDLVLETGHSAPPESLLIIAEAKRQRVKHVLVTHAMASPAMVARAIIAREQGHFDVARDLLDRASQLGRSTGYVAGMIETERAELALMTPPPDPDGALLPAMVVLTSRVTVGLSVNT